jgi:hypothetical protein
MYDELVKQLRELAGEQMFDFERQPYLQAADAIEQLSKDLERSKEWEAFWEKEANEALKKFQTTVARMPRWIPVTERLPEVGEQVLCYCRANIYEVMKMRTDGVWVHNDKVYDSAYMSGFVTHWMPLPGAPTEE